MRLWQFQQKAEPILDEQQRPEQVLLDKWFHPPEFRPKKSVLPTAVFATSLFFVNIFPAPPEDITVDKWFAPTQQPYFVKKPLVQEGLSVVDADQLIQTENVLLDKWYQPASEPVRTKKPLVPEGWFVVDADQLIQSESVLLDKWFAPASEPLFDKKRQQYGYPVFSFWPEPILVPEVISLDKWYARTSEPLFDKARQQHTYPAVWFWAEPIPNLAIPQGGLLQAGQVTFTRLTQYQVKAEPVLVEAVPEVVTVDKWFQPASEPVRTVKPLVQEGASVIDSDQLTQPENILPDKWFVAASEPVRTKKPLVPEGWVVADADQLTQVESVLPDKWFVKPSEPLFRKGRALDVGKSVVDANLLTQPEAVLLDKWYRPASEPIFDKRREQHGYPTFWFWPEPLPTVEVVTVDKWFARTSEPLFQKGRAVGVGIRVVDSDLLTRAESVLLDKWYRPASEPLFRAPRKVDVGKRVVDTDVFLQPEAILLDKWFQRASEPLFRKGRAVDVGISVIDADLLTRTESILLDKWFVRPPDPFFDKQRNQHLYPTFSLWPEPIAPPPVIGLDSWYQKPSEPLFRKGRAVDVGVQVIEIAEVPAPPKPVVVGGTDKRRVRILRRPFPEKEELPLKTVELETVPIEVLSDAKALLRISRTFFPLSQTGLIQARTFARAKLGAEVHLIGLDLVRTDAASSLTLSRRVWSHTATMRETLESEREKLLELDVAKRTEIILRNIPKPPEPKPPKPLKRYVTVLEPVADAEVRIRFQEISAHSRKKIDRELTSLLKQVDGIKNVTVREFVTLLNQLRRQVILAIMEFGEVSPVTADAIKNRVATIISEHKDILATNLSDNQRRLFVKGIQTVDRAVKSADLTLAIPFLSEETLEQVKAFGADLITNITGTVQSQIAQEIDLAVLGQKPISDVVKAVGRNLKDPSIFNTIRKRAQTIVRTEVNRIQQLAGTERLEQASEQIPDMMKQWVHAHVGTPRPGHLALHLKVIGATERFDLRGQDGKLYKVAAPFDPILPAGEVVNCFPADTIVEGLEIEAAMRSLYSGQFVTIKTAGGHELTATPNHPILTPFGFVAVGELQDGDAVFCGDFGEKVLLSDPDIQRGPTALNQIFRALAQFGFQQRIRRVDVNFYGDRPDGDVDIVWANSFLKSRSNFLPRKPMSKKSFTSTNFRQRFFSGNGLLVKFLRQSPSSASGYMGGFGEASSFNAGQPGHPDEIGLMAITDMKSRLNQMRSNYPPTQMESFRQSKFRHSRFVETSEQWAIKNLSVAGSGNSVCAKDSVETRTTDGEFFAHIFDHLTSAIGLDYIVGISRRKVESVHVFTLQTGSGIYKATNTKATTKGLIVRNCHCKAVPVVGRFLK